MEIKKTPDGLEIPPPSPDDVLCSKQDGYVIIRLNRPVVLNAMNKNIQRLLMAALEDAESDDSVAAIMLTGAGRAFSAGGDMYSYLYPDDDPAPGGIDVQMKIWSSRKPVVAVVKGYALGQGCELAAICDMTIASHDARFGEIQIRQGSPPPVLITPFVVGIKNAKELLMLGEQIDANEALRIGLINKIVGPDQNLEAYAISVMTKLVSLPRATVSLNKTLINRAYEIAGFREAIAYKDDENIGLMLNATEDDEEAKEKRRLLREEGWGAFKAKRDGLYN
jgi:enoyl-CoA hydratase/carnithine racemase